MAKYLLPLLCVLVSCSPTSMNQCVDDADCGESLICDDGTCIAQPATACRSDETRPCGPAAVGSCRPGVFRCIDGAFETTCFGELTAADETCNGLDDDCDGEIDDGVSMTFSVDRDGDGFGSSAMGAETRQGCLQPSGFVANASDCDDSNVQRKPSASEICDQFDVDENCDGVANEGCGCTTPGMTQACCSARGTQTCEARDGGAMLSMCTVQPSAERCNAVDDDCDGQTDELFIVSTADGGVPTLDAGTILPDGGCAIGVGACARTAGIACVQGSLSCLAVAGTPGAEVCNTLDDDCDGETDEVSLGLCPAAGQTCSGGACACPSGQTVCGARCETLGGSCSNGVGACARTGAIACVSGGPACNAVPGTPATETCDGVDNDCDGQTDEGVQVQCYPDADNDRYIGSLTTTWQCPDTTRPSFGNCPSGHVAAGSSLGGATDCDDSNAAVFTSAAVRRDGDADGYCSGQTFSQCIGTNPQSGWRFATLCQATDDCNESTASQFILRTVRNDIDGDGYCVGASFAQCGGATPSGGTRVATTCNATDDCLDSDGAKYRLLSVMADLDGDFTCAGAVLQQCTGQNPQPGYRLSADCSPFGGAPPIDCNDGNASEWQLLSVRPDADGDTWCSGNAFSQCTNNAPKGGYRLATQCAGDDCRDSNANATSICTRAVWSQTRIKACGAFIPATQSLSFDWQCPTGFQALNAQFSLEAGVRMTDPALLNPLVIGSSGTTFMNFTCRNGAIGENSWLLNLSCGAL